jgi:NAD(P)-dependent dehydrogenase (short-subunit alcohol dehydrogenase family)
VTSTNNAFGLEGRTCVVTGGGSGIGQGVAIALAGEGAKVALLDVNDRGNQETMDLIAKVGGTGLALHCDVSNLTSIESARDTIRAQFGDPKILVNVAGIIRRGGIESLALEDWNAVLAINLTGYFLCSQVFGRAMLEQRDGVLVHVTSVMSDFPSPYTGAYSVTKAGVRMLSRQLAIEWGASGVRSNCVAPSLIITPMSQGTYDIPGVMERRCAAVPLGRIGLPADIAQAVLFLVSPRAAYVNGTELLVDGGFMSNLMSLVPRAAPPLKV